MSRINSNYGDALSAVSLFNQSGNWTEQTFSLGESNLAGMRQAVDVSNRIVAELTKLEATVKQEADKFPKLAAIIEARDRQDSASFSQQSWGFE